MQAWAVLVLAILLFVSASCGGGGSSTGDPFCVALQRYESEGFASREAVNTAFGDLESKAPEAIAEDVREVRKILFGEISISNPGGVLLTANALNVSEFANSECDVDGLAVIGDADRAVHGEVVP